MHEQHTEHTENRNTDSVCVILTLDIPEVVVVIPNCPAFTRNSPYKHTHSNSLSPVIHTPYMKVSFEAFVLFAQAPDEGNYKTHRHIQWAHMGVCNGQTDIQPEKVMAATLSYFL